MIRGAIFTPGYSLGGSRPTLSKAAAIPLYLSILGGTCLGMGLVYAGTGREDGKLALLGILKRLQR